MPIAVNDDPCGLLDTVSPFQCCLPLSLFFWDYCFTGPELVPLWTSLLSFWPIAPMIILRFLLACGSFLSVYFPYLSPLLCLSHVNDVNPLSTVIGIKMSPESSLSGYF